MGNYSSYTERDAFNEVLFDKINEYQEDREQYSDTVVLAINKKNKSVELGDSEVFDSKWDIYRPEKLIRTDESGNHEPDVDEIFELASGYCFVR